jgi:16S rRNA (cytidine1402-2'-O)-methyltransferase
MLILAATPLGNPLDASANLRTAIEQASFIAAEDTRKFSRLCADLAIPYKSLTAKVISYFEGNELERLPQLIEILESGADLLVITDAGMPGVSDPGFRLVRAAIDHGISIKVLPGPSAVTTALLLSGLPTDRFCFEGFPPRTTISRQKWFEELAEEERTIILFEAPHRLFETLRDAHQVFGPDRQGAICREMTKTYEEVIRGNLSELVHWAEHNEIRGEITLVLSGYHPTSINYTNEQLFSLVQKQEQAGISRKEAISIVAKETSVPKREVFNAVVNSKTANK